MRRSSRRAARSSVSRSCWARRPSRSVSAAMRAARASASWWRSDSVTSCRSARSRAMSRRRSAMSAQRAARTSGVVEVRVLRKRSMAGS
ncbi:hypothetical protein SM8_032090 [Streptomyces sp. SM8]|nr:hypothetical protein SM8_032090 [Streptomyces sp. SM8]